MTHLFVLRMHHEPSLMDATLRAAHRGWVEAQYDAGLFIASGPVVGGDGGVALAAGVNREQVDAALVDDPVVRARVGRYEVTEVEVTLFSEELGALFGARPKDPD